MKRCYENYFLGKWSDWNHCGHAVATSDKYFYFCPADGNLYKICGYVGRCGYINVPDDLKEIQLSFFEKKEN